MSDPNDLEDFDEQLMRESLKERLSKEYLNEIKEQLYINAAARVIT